MDSQNLIKLVLALHALTKLVELAYQLVLILVILVEQIGFWTKLIKNAYVLMEHLKIQYKFVPLVIRIVKLVQEVFPLNVYLVMILIEF